MLPRESLPPEPGTGHSRVTCLVVWVPTLWLLTSAAKPGGLRDVPPAPPPCASCTGTDNVALMIWP